MKIHGGPVAQHPTAIRWPLAGRCRPSVAGVAPGGQPLLEFLHEPLAFGTDLVDELGVGANCCRKRHRPRLRVRLWVVDGDLDIEMPKIGPPDALAHLPGPVIMLPSQSIHRSSRNPIVSITSVSSDQVADEYPCHDGFGASGNGRPSVKTWR